MKLKLFNGLVTNVSLSVLAGGYDPETQRVVLIVRGDNDTAGNVTLDVAEAHRLAKQITLGLPQVERIEGILVDPAVLDNKKGVK